MVILGAEFEKSAPSVSSAPPPDLPEVCFAGRSNVGKSSALNVLTNRRQLARVSKTPGRTRLLNFFRVELADRPGPNRRTAALRLCDLPGYGHAEAPKRDRETWGAMVTAYLRERESLRAVVMLVDAQVGPQPKDHEMLEFLAAGRLPLVVAATKSDRLARTRLSSALDRVARELGLPREAVLAFSAKTAVGRDELWNVLCAASGILGRNDTGRLLSPVEEER